MSLSSVLACVVLSYLLSVLSVLVAVLLQGLIDHAQKDAAAVGTSLQAGRLAHAYLFAGPRGIGKTTIERLTDAALGDVMFVALGSSTEVASVDEDQLIVEGIGVYMVTDRVGFAVEDRDRSAGIYYVRYNDPSKQDADQGWLSKLAFWSSDDEQQVQHYQIKLSDEGDDTRVVVLDEQGDPETSVAGVLILTLLYEELK